MSEPEPDRCIDTTGSALSLLSRYDGIVWDLVVEQVRQKFTSDT